MMKERILLALSGGVDSAVAALLLKQENYEVIACTVKMHKNTDISTAENIAKFLCIKHIIIDATSKFQDIVIRNFCDAYVAGRTPNPCVLCNREIKWKELVAVADELGIRKIATGHYATIKYYNELERYTVANSTDISKDQTYMLWRLPQEYLARTIFPLGNISSKIEVRKLAADSKIPSFDKGDSQDICFISDGDYRKFLQEYFASNNCTNNNHANNNHTNNSSGNIIFNGQVLGKHNGYQNYTIGQRRGLGVSYSEPLYVKSINAVSNEVTVGIAEDLFSNGLIATDINLLKYSLENFPEKEYIVKIRYKDFGKLAVCSIINNQLIVNFSEKRKAVTPGQSVVIYENYEVVAGGIILA